MEQNQEMIHLKEIKEIEDPDEENMVDNEENQL